MSKNFKLLPATAGLVVEAPWHGSGSDKPSTRTVNLPVVAWQCCWAEDGLELTPVVIDDHRADAVTLPNYAWRHQEVDLNECRVRSVTAVAAERS
ncbi:hypothetical protein [Micromonospora sp. CA-111912]|uniref:hypothetical protein n=1 Tax=Micromonospora sp. CA-111912 TaxID=3239955 RepID=UPI003D8B7779